MALPPDQTVRFTGLLRKAGIRITRQRIALMAVLTKATDHPDAIELHKRTKALEPSTSLATIYRTLAALEAKGVIQHHNFEGNGSRFELVPETHHDHIVDLDSGKVIEFKSDKIERIQAEIAAHLGYEVLHHRFELYCRKIPNKD